MILALAAMALAAAQNTEAPRAGFSAAELAERPSGRDTPSVRSALARAEAIRAALILDPAATAGIIDPMETRALQSALGTFDPASSAQISYFMRGAVTRVSQAPAGLVTGYYNPLLDMWLVTPLDRVAGEWRIIGATVIDGRALRGGGTVWSDAPTSPLRSLVENYRASIVGFGRHVAGPERPLEANAFQLLADRTNSWMSSLAAWRQNAAGRGAAETVRAEIAAGGLGRSHAAALDTARQIDALPAAVRATMTIIGAARHADGISLFIASPVQPNLILVLDMDSHDQSRGITIVNLANLPEASSLT